MMRLNTFLRSASAFAAVVLALGTTARAQMVQYTPLFPGLYPTGYNSSGMLLPASAPSSTGEGYADAHYSVVHVYSFANGTAVTSTQSKFTQYTGAPRVTQGFPGVWNTAVQNSQWIEPPGGAWSNVDGQNFYDFSGGAGMTPQSDIGYDYQIVFTVPSTYNLSTVTIGGTVAADDYLYIYLNNDTSQTLQYVAANMFNSPAPFTLSTAQGLVLGVNTLTFYVFNNAPSPNPTGLDVISIGSGTFTTTSAPEIGAYLPVAGAILLYGAIFVARRRSIRIRRGISPV
jgi:hypothetical protein